MQKRPKKELLRLVCTPENKIKVDRAQNLPGRGCYICPQIQCLETAIKKHKFSRAFRKKIQVDALNLLGQINGRS
ncbi:YlxR family protein [candidate division KSB1 bacterium]|nr:YlxR family protein [candidate division KSB1 bacterium]